MLMSTWLMAVKSRIQASRPVRRRLTLRRPATAPEGLETRSLLTTTLQGVRPNVGEFLSPGEIRNVAPQELTLQFSLGSDIVDASITSQAIQVVRSGDDGVFGNGNDVPVTIGYVGPGAVPNDVVLRFGENLRDEHYRIVVTGTGPNRLQSTVGGVADPVQSSTFDFELDLGARVIAIDPQPVTRQADGSLTQARDQIVVYFNNDDLNAASATNPAFYQLIFTNETVTTQDDVVHLPTTVAYDAVSDTAVLTFASEIATLSGAGSYRLRIGTSESQPLAPVTTIVGVDPGSSFATANTVLGSIDPSSTSSHVLSAAIDPQLLPYQFPGADDEPGHRRIEVENHLLGGPDSGASGIPLISYNFKDVYGTDPSGNVLHNLITEAQKERAREIFEYYGYYAGVDFRETASAGLTIVTGDLRALDPTIPTGPGGVAGLAGGGTAIMDMAEVWDDEAGGNWFTVAMHEIGHLLGLGHTYDLPSIGVQGSGADGSAGVGTEPDYPGDHDITHMRHLYRPDSIDIDLYRFEVTTQTAFSAEILAERQSNSSNLDSVLRLYREVNGVRELISQNDDYFSNDSYLELLLQPGVYFVGVSSTGNDAYDPTIANTGIGGTSQGAYDLRVNFRPQIVQSLVDTTGQLFDGNSDGLAGGVYNFWFNASSSTNTLFVDKTHVANLTAAVTSTATQIVVQRTSPYTVGEVIRVRNEQMQITAINAVTRTLTVVRAINGSTAASHGVGVPVRRLASDGQIGTPFGLINDALAAATPGRIVRIVGSGGADGNPGSAADNLPYEIGVNPSNQALVDGTALEVPRGVTVMIDKGAVLKLRRAVIGVGSTSAGVDRSGNGLQVLGVPGQQVVFTSWNDESIGTDTTATPTSPIAGDWGGLAFRTEVDRAQNRYTPSNEGIFLNYVAHADIRYGGGNVTIDSVLQPVSPIHMDRAQPTVVYNTITRSAESAMSADPDSFEELTFHSPRFQSGKPAFTADYKRVGPEIYGNTQLLNGNNGLFVRVDTPAGGLPQKMTVPGRFDDADIVHIVAQNLEIAGTPGGSFFDQVAPSVTLVTLTAQSGGTLAAGTYSYRVVFVDENGFESPASASTTTLTIASPRSIRLAQLPPASGVYTGRRIYRSDPSAPGTWRLAGELDKSATTFLDTGVTLARSFTDATAPGARNRAQLNGRLSIDPGIVVKLQGSRIETEIGAQLIAEGAPGRQVIFTSRLDDRYGAGGTFDTNNDDLAVTESTPAAGDWGGLYVGHTSSASIDRALITFGGGLTTVGSGFQRFNAVEVHQADARIRNSVFELNADGSSSGYRTGLFPNATGTIFVRAAQPVILDNTFVGNAGPVININTNALNYELVTDTGRSTGLVDRQLSYGDNQGPLIRDNIFDGNQQNGMVVRGESVTTLVVMDDTDIVHIVTSEIYIPNFHTYGGVRLESNPTESLVLKLSGANAGFNVGGFPLDIVDRIGGMLHVIGQPGQPVIMTSLADDSVGAGFNLAGLLQRDTNNNGSATAPAAGNWRGIRIGTYSHDRNVAVHVENETPDRLSAESNSTTGNAENIGSLAGNQKYGDENLRLGIELHGFTDNPSDVDVFSFSGVAGSQVWLDIDRSTHALDTVIELLDADGNIFAQSDNYLDEKNGVWPVFIPAGSSTQAFGTDFSPYLSDDQYSTNPRDAAMRVVLPGTSGLRGTYFVRVRSSNIDSTTLAPRTDLQDPSLVDAGLTSGAYQLQLRLQERDELAGTTVQYADIRFASTGIEIVGQPTHSPLLGENEEVEGNDQSSSANSLGNLMNQDRAALAVRGNIPVSNDIDFYQFEVNYTHTQQIPGSSLTAPHVPVVFDLDYADGMSRANTTLAVFDSANRLILIGRDSNIADDQPGPLEGSDIDDLSRGSVGTFDPFIGAVELPGGTYTLAVFNNRHLPAVLDQYFTPGSQNPLLRMEPVNSVNRLFEERFTAGDNDTQTAAGGGAVNLFNVDAAGNLNARHAVPYHLGDVVLFASLPGGLKGTDESTVISVNPFTGALMTALGSFGPSTADIAMRPDGRLFSFSTGPAGNGESTSAVTGNYLQIDTGTAAATSLGDDGITTNRDNLDNNGALTPGDNNVTDANAGMIFEAMTFTGTGDKNLFAVGRRATVTPPANSALVAAFTTNVLYRFDIRTGAVDGVPADRTNDARAYQGAGTTQREIGQVAALGTVTGLAQVGGQGFAVDNIGNLYQVNLNNAATTFIANLGFAFSGLSAGPDEVEGGAFANVLFATTAAGDLVAFDTAGNLEPVFVNGQSSVSTGIAGLNGLAFSTLDRNLWATTTNRGTDLGHGVETRFDGSVLATREDGGRSLYFGNQRNGAAAGNQNDLNAALQRNYNFPGGAHGSVISNAFDLSTYSKSDKPTLYFNYLLLTEGTNYAPGSAATLMRDALRVFIADDRGDWSLLTTNNSFQDSAQADEFDIGPFDSATQAPVTQTHPDVNETFDGQANWRQARLDLSNYAGLRNLRLRFDFSTAGSMGIGDVSLTGSELRALPGASLRDGDTFVISGVTFEFELGATLVASSGAAAIGDTFTVGGQTFTFVSAPGGVTDIVISASSTPFEVAAAAQAAVNAVLGAGSALMPATGGNRVTFPGQSVTASSGGLIVEGAAGVVGANRPVVITPLMSAAEVATVIRQALADEFSGGDITNIKGHEDLIRVIGQTADNEGPLGLEASLAGDSFGAFTTGFQNGSVPGSLRGMNNTFEGVYLDDFVLGFAERGEMVINAPGNPTITLNGNRDVTNPNYPAGNEYLGIDQGRYDVEIRRAADYGETQSSPPINALYRSIDTNDRESETLSVVVTDTAQLQHRSTMTVSDGVNQVIFEFLDTTSGDAVTPGFFAIPFNPGVVIDGNQRIEPARILARRLRDAINSVTVQNVIRVKASLSDGTASGTTGRDVRLHLTGNAIVTLSAGVAGVLTEQRFDAFGDQNHFRDQGQLIVRSSTVSDSAGYGISVDAAPRTPILSSQGPPHPGSVRNLQEVNTDRLATSVVIMNNVITSNVTGAINFSGDQVNGPFGVVPYGRIVNNTLVGRNGSGIGVNVEQSASPTLLNNIVADFATGFAIDGSSAAAGTTLGNNLYRGNGVNSTAGTGAFPIFLGAGDPLFVDQANRNYYLAPNSQAIDSSVTSVGDREALRTVKNPLDLDGTDDAGSPILAPELDVYGQLRGNDPDVETPAGQGASVFIDRGAIDRVDFFQPRAQLVNPEDQSLIDGDADVDEVWIDQSQVLRQFRVRLVDEGIGVDGLTVTSSQFVLKRVDTDGVTEITLVDGVDYTFVYNVITREAIFNAATIFADETTEARYIILVENDGLSTGDTINGVRDRAGNYLLPNRSDGTTRFDIVLTDGVNDPPVNNVPTAVQVTPEDTALFFTTANSNRITLFDEDGHLGTNILQITLTATNGVLTLGLLTGLSFLAGDGTADASMMFTGKLQDINNALNGLRFVPAADYFGPASITIVSDDQGEFSGPAASDTDVIQIDVTPVNDAPTFNPVSNPAAVGEHLADLGITVAGFMTGQVAGPANETPPQTITAQLTVQSVTGSWTTATFFAVAPAINTVTGNLTYTTAQDVNGTALIRVVLVDSEGGVSIAQTFTITVNAVNDEPVYAVNAAALPISSNEDAGPQVVDLINTFGPARATAIDELPTQTVTWDLSGLTITSGNLVLTALSIDADGTLRYTAAADTAGTATVNLKLFDNGASTAPDDNESVTTVLTITVVQVNDPPVAIAPDFTIDEGDNLLLDASASFDVDAFFGDTLTYAWDLNNDGTFETLAGGSPTFSRTWAQLLALGITAPGSFPIRLRVTDTSSATGFDNSTLTTLIVDYGDALDSYGTLKTSNGAAHTITGPLQLGATRDKELTGQPTVLANGDGADEDGVTFPTTIEADAVLALPAFVDVSSTGSGKLDLWLDLNLDGDFDHATEHLNGGTSVNVIAGVNRVFFTIPAGTSTGDSILRVRLSTAGSLQPTGRATDGEVEDYAVKIRPLQAPVTPVINRPIDFNPGDGQIPQTTDLSPFLAWTLHEANYSYDVIVRNASNVIVFQTTGLLFNSVDLPVLPAGVYTATVTARNKAGVAAADASWQFQIVPLVVSGPTGEINTSRPTIQWNHVPGSKTYTVIIESITTGLPVVNSVIDTSTAVPPNQLALTTDLPLGRYRVRVRATDAADLPGDFSPFVEFKVATAPVISSPSGSVTNLRPNVVWNGITGATSYQLELTNLTDNTAPQVVSGIMATSWTPPANLILAEYSVRVRALNVVGDIGLWSAAQTFTVAPQVTTITPLGRLADNTPTFSWNAVAGAERYRLIVTEGFGTNQVVVSQLALTTTTFTQMTPLPLGRYQYTIQAENLPSNGSMTASALSTLSQTYEVTITERPVVTNPPSTTFEANPTVTWTNPAGSNASTISEVWLNKKEGTNSFRIHYAQNLTGTSYVIPDPLILGTYVVWVRTFSSVDPTVVSEWSIARTFRVTTPPVLIGPEGRTPDPTPSLTWQGVPGGQTYQVYISSVSPSVVVYNVSGLNSLSYTVPANLPIGRYNWWVRATSAFGDISNWSIPKQFQVVNGPVLSGPSSSTFDATPTFNWTSLSIPLNGQPAGATSYDFRLDQVLATTVVENFHTKTGLTGTTYTIPTNLPQGLYRAYVRGRNSNTQGDYSTALEFFVGGRPNVNAIGNTADTTPTITWQTVDGASRYEIFIALAATPNTALIRQDGLGSTSYTVTTPLAKAAYRVWVRAFNSETGTFGLWSVGTDFTIVDAEDIAVPAGSRWVLTALPAALHDASTDAAVSMLPARVAGTDSWNMVAGESTVTPAADVVPAAEMPVETVPVVPAASTDDVLSTWHDQAWWDNGVVADPAVAAPQSEPSRRPVAATILGALLSLTPQVLRRRKGEREQGR